MNVYSIRLIPSLKLKFCQFLGIASTMAVEELSDRLFRLEQKLDRLDGHLRRSARRSLVVPTLSATALKKKSPKSRKPAVSKTLPKKPRLAEVTEIKRITPVLEEVVLSQPEPLTVAVESQPQTLKEVVILIQADEATRRIAQDYFGSEVRFLELAQVQDLPASLQDQRVLAVIFDRVLWGDAAARSALEDFRQRCSDAKLVGLSSYLTLAFAESMPHREDAATFLTRPLSLEALAGIFQQGAKEAIS